MRIIIKKEGDMSIEEMKESAGGFLKKELFRIKCKSGEYTVTGAGAAAAVSLVLLHAVIIKCICCKKEMLKLEKCRLKEENKQIKEKQKTMP